MDTPPRLRSIEQYKNDSRATYVMDIGDCIRVGDNLFVLVEHTETFNKPARVVFKQPIELVGVDSD